MPNIYLEEAAALLRQAREANDRRASLVPSRRAGNLPVDDLLREVNDRRMELAAAFARLAAIEADQPDR
jgi:hypothetical protein